MAAAIPTQIPQSITAGDTSKWTVRLTDYSASDGWVLSYAFLRLVTGELITFSSTASGSNHLISLAVTDTQLWLDGEYNGQAYVTLGAERYKVSDEVLTVLPNFVNAGQIDTRTKARRILDFIDASFEKLVKKQTVECTIEGVQLRFRTLKELQEARDYWAPVVSAEDAISSGVGSKRSILAVFTAPC